MSHPYGIRSGPKGDTPWPGPGRVQAEGRKPEQVCGGPRFAACLGVPSSVTRSRRQAAQAGSGGSPRWSTVTTATLSQLPTQPSDLGQARANGATAPCRGRQRRPKRGSPPERSGGGAPPCLPSRSTALGPGHCPGLRPPRPQAGEMPKGTKKAPEGALLKHFASFVDRIFSFPDTVSQVADVHECRVNLVRFELPGRRAGKDDSEPDQLLDTGRYMRLRYA